jgi:molecular chaperone DnaJ
MKRFFYEILGIQRLRCCNKKAYRKKALEFHPDKTPGTKRQRNNWEAAEAYEVLAIQTKKQVRSIWSSGF